jgi:hypothetical protein
MSDGPCGDGLNYYAAFQITGNLDQAKLKEVVAQIKAILQGNIRGQAVGGRLLKSARIRASGFLHTDDGQKQPLEGPQIDIKI